MPDTAILLTRAHNYAVVQLPERRFPGVVVQGDTLNALVKRLDAMQTLLAEGSSRELGFEIAEMRRELAEVIASYEMVCRNHSIELPYRSA
jgi:predicted RNase H-like HicB family nuclease